MDMKPTHTTDDAHAGHDHDSAAAPGAEGLKDPVCGMAVTAQSDHHAAHDGRPYYFCSAKCQATFTAEPARYVDGDAEPNPAATQPPVAGTVYTCPMHPEIRQDHPGSCPKCGMALEPVMPTLEEDDNPELADFTRRFWWTLPFSAAVMVLAMAGHSLGWFAPQ